MDKIALAMLNKVSVGVVVIDCLCHVVYWNQWMEKATGRLASAVIGLPVEEVSPKFMEYFYKTVLTNALQGQAQFCAGAIHKALFLPSCHENTSAIRQNVQFDPVTVGGEPFVLLQVTDVTEQNERVKRCSQATVRPADTIPQRGVPPASSTGTAFQTVLSIGVNLQTIMKEAVQNKIVDFFAGIQQDYPDMVKVTPTEYQVFLAANTDCIAVAEFASSMEGRLRSIKGVDTVSTGIVVQTLAGEEALLRQKANLAMWIARSMGDYQTVFYNELMDELIWERHARKQLERKLEQSEFSHERLIQNIPAAFLYAQLVGEAPNALQQMIIKVANPAMENLLGISFVPAMQIPLSVMQTIVGEQSAEALVIYWKLMINGEKLEVERFMPGIAKWFAITAYSPEENHLAVIAQDITERKRIENLRMDLVRKSARTERMASVGLMASSISHELNQPLQALKVHVDGVRFLRSFHGAASSEEDDLDLEFVAEQVDRMADKIRFLNTYVAATKIEDETTFTIQGVLSAAINCLAACLEDNQVVVSTPSEPGLWLFGDAGRFEEVILAILRNAVEAMDQQAPETRFITVTTAVEENTGIICIRDTGGGLDREAIQKAFQPFFTTKLVTTGMGLGLTMARAIVETYHGTIAICNNTPAAGATVTIRIPLPAGKDEVRASNGQPYR